MSDPATLPDLAPAAVSSAPASAGILGIGSADPDQVVTSEEIAGRLGIDPGWIFERTGISSRPHAGEGDTLTGLATAAAGQALAAAALEPRDLDLVLVASFTQDELLPNAAPQVATALGARGAGACDLGAACSGFLSGLSLATAQIEAGRARNALVVGADLVTRSLDHSDRKTAGLFADGAGAAVLGAGAPGWIGEIILHSDARQADCIVANRDERVIRMRGQDTFRAAVDALSDVTLEVLAAEQLETSEIDVFVYHQANARITRAVGERLGLDPGRVVDCIEYQGNTSAATLPLALCHAARAGMLRPGSTVLLGTFGAGLTWGAGVIEWGGEVAR